MDVFIVSGIGIDILPRMISRRTFAAGMGGMAGGLARAAEDAPKAAIGNGKLKAEVYLPDAARGYYRGSRFDWSGVVKSLEFAGHSYFGVWFPRYDPLLHDAITGPVEEFLSGGEALGYSEAKEGEAFVRIGIGALKKAGAKFERFKTYELMDPGTWKVKAGKDRVTFQQELRRPVLGYAYRYEKTLRMEKDQPVLWIEHRLRNLGKRAIETECYNHNFFVIDGAKSGPDLEVTFPFDLKAKRELKPPGVIKGRSIGYERLLARGESVYTELEGFGTKPEDYDIRVVNRASGAAVRITGDRPLSKLVFWSIPTVLSPEPYISLKAEPGGEERWKLRYEFQTK
jgi:hypothetical protein